MTKTFRQSISWLHTWSGLILGWICFAIFFTGTYSYFKNEITYWMKPEAHTVRTENLDTAELAEAALRYLENNAPDVAEWSISLPDSRMPVLQAGYRERLPKDLKQEDYVRSHVPMTVVDPETGEGIKTRDTDGGNFLYRFHIELYGMDRKIGREIVGIATMLMFVALISGVIIHRRIFSDFFTFRRGKGARSWIDIHAFTGVLTLPYLAMIIYSGLVLLMISVLPWNAKIVSQAFDKHINDHMKAEQVDAPEVKQALTDIKPLIKDAEKRLNAKIGSITVSNPYADNMLIVMMASRGNDVIGGFKGTGVAGRAVYKGTNGRFMGLMNMTPSNPFGKTSGVLSSFHLARFADTFTRWLFFVSGTLGTVMIGTGLIIWTSKKSGNTKKSFGRKLVEILNVGAIAGLTAAVAVHLWANRLLPEDMPMRADWEIRIFFIAWLLFAVYPLVRPVEKAWMEEFSIGAVLFLLLPVLNGFTSQVNFFSFDPIITGFDFVAVGIGALLGYGAWRMRRFDNKNYVKEEA